MVADICVASRPERLLGGDGAHTNRLPAGDNAAATWSNHVFVELRVSDQRGPDKRLASKSGPYGEEGGPIYATNDVLQVIKGALETELGQRGFAIGPGGAAVSVELVRFRSEVRPRFSYGHAFNAEMILSITVARSDGLGVFSRTITGNGTETGYQSGSIAKVALDRALGAAIAATVDDKSFVDAILAASARSN